MKTFILFIVCCFVSYTYSQDNTTLLKSQGDIPQFLTKHTHDSYLIPDITSWQYIKKLDKSSTLDLIYSSNMIVFGDPISDYCTRLVQKITQTNQNVYTVRSNYIGTFINENGDIFITSGLISNLSYESQLAFFLLRELELQQYQQPNTNYKNAGVLTLDKLIGLAGTYSDEHVREAEKKVFDRLVALKYSEYEILSSYDLLLYKEAPFFEKQFEWNYFNNGHVLIPQTEYTSVVNPKPKTYNPEQIYPKVVLRRNNLSSNYSKPQHFNPAVLIDLSLFNDVIRHGRMESVNLRIMNAEFIMALYEIYILESFGTFNDYLNTMKVLSWWGIVKERNHEIEKVDFTEYQISDNEGAYFSRYIKRQQTGAVVALAFRHVYDALKEQPQSHLYNNILKDLVRLSGKTKNFSITQFYKYNYTDLIDSLSKSATVNDQSEFTDKHDQLQKINSTDTLKNYHLYILPDFISDNNIIQLFQDSSMLHKKDYENRTVEYTTFSFNPYKKGRTINSKKKGKISIDQLNSNLTAHSIKITPLSTSYTLDDYQHKYRINYTIFQNYHHNRFKSAVLPIKSDMISKSKISDENNLLGLGFYNHAYRPKLRGFHLLGLAGVTLPYIIPEFFFRGHKSQTIVFLFDTQTGEMVNSSNRKYNDPYSRLNIENDILNTTFNTLR